jgi:hypothetical protein
VAKGTPVAISKALELFLVELVTDAVRPSEFHVGRDSLYASCHGFLTLQGRRPVRPRPLAPSRCNRRT